MTSFLNRKTNLEIYKLDQEPDFEKMLLSMNSREVRDIRQEKTVLEKYYVQLTNEDSTAVKLEDGILGFSLRVDQKDYSKKQFKILLDQWKEQFILDNKREPEEDEIDEESNNILGNLCEGQYAKTYLCGCIIDTHTKRVFIEKKGGLGSMIVMELYRDFGMKVSVFNPYEKINIPNTNAKQAYMEWLYVAQQTQGEIIHDDKRITLGKQIRLRDDSNEIQLKGKIVKFIDIYQKMLSGATVRECSVDYRDQTLVSYKYKLNFDKSVYAGLEMKGTPTKGEDERSTVHFRNSAFNSFADHLIMMTKIFKKEMEL